MSRFAILAVLVLWVVFFAALAAGRPPDAAAEQRAGVEKRTYGSDGRSLYRLGDTWLVFVGCNPAAAP